LAEWPHPDFGQRPTSGIEPTLLAPGSFVLREFAAALDWLARHLRFNVAGSPVPILRGIEMTHALFAQPKRQE